MINILPITIFTSQLWLVYMALSLHINTESLKPECIKQVVTSYDNKRQYPIRGGHKKKWEKLVFWTNQGRGGLTESQLFGKISQN